MNIRIGDIVRFISEKMEGKVTGIIDNTTVNIFVDDYGFEIPASTSDLVVSTLMSILLNRSSSAARTSSRYKKG